MKTFLVAFAAALVAMVPIDALWLTTMSKQFYARHLAHLFAENVSFFPAGLFYVIYAAALALLVVLPAVEGDYSLGKTYLYGMVFGLAAYAAYDLTNQATLRDWPTVVTVFDLAWGAFMTGVVATLATLVTRYFV